MIEGPNLTDFEQLRAKHRSEIRKLRAQLRTALADYIGSEGCDCCRGSDHREHGAALGKLLRVQKYSDWDGYNFGRYESKVKK